MTLLGILKDKLLNKKIIAGRWGIGAIILDVRLAGYDPVFELRLKYPDNKESWITFLEDENIEVK